MDGMSLVLRAIDAGLNVEIEGGTLVITGAVSQQGLAREVLAQKQAVMPAIESGIAAAYGRWCEDARIHYQERLGIADELGLDTAVGSAAEAIARREAERVSAGVPHALWPERGVTNVIDAAMAALAPLTRLTFGGYLDDPPPPPSEPGQQARLS